MNTSTGPQINGRGNTIRTCGLLNPIQALYQAELYPERPATISTEGVVKHGPEAPLEPLPTHLACKRHNFSTQLAHTLERIAQCIHLHAKLRTRRGLPSSLDQGLART